MTTTVRRSAKPGKPPGTPRSSGGDIKVAISQLPVPRLPHERDESPDSPAGEPQKIIQQAATDLKRGLEDTDRGPQMNRMSTKLKRSP